MTTTKKFIEREVFNEVIEDVPRVDGRKYEDVDTIYGDMSRLIVAWLATTPPRKLREIYNELGWGGDANGRAIHEAAKRWMSIHRPNSICKKTVK